MLPKTFSYRVLSRVREIGTENAKGYHLSRGCPQDCPPHTGTACADGEFHKPPFATSYLVASTRRLTPPLDNATFGRITARWGWIGRLATIGHVHVRFALDFQNLRLFRP